MVADYTVRVGNCIIGKKVQSLHIRLRLWQAWSWNQCMVTQKFVKFKCLYSVPFCDIPYQA